MSCMKYQGFKNVGFGRNSACESFGRLDGVTSQDGNFHSHVRTLRLAYQIVFEWNEIKF
jgi:hypothetical protein